MKSGMNSGMKSGMSVRQAIREATNMKKRFLVMLAALGLALSAAHAEDTIPAGQVMGEMPRESSESGTTQATTPNPMPGMEHGSMEGMDHSTMPGMEHGSMEGMDHSTMPGMDHSSMEGMDHSTMPGMDHGTMSGMNHGTMQGGTAPPDARDPHAYSGGYTLVSGPYVLPGPRLLHLADEHSFGSLLVDRLETVHTTDNNAAAYDVQAWYGRDDDRAVLKAEGSVDNGTVEEASTELLWGHAVTAYWNTQLGVRLDGGDGPHRGWLAAGVQGLAPYWFEVDATAYVGREGRTALNLAAEYDLLFTQRLILQPRVEADVYGKDDKERGIGAGLSEAVAGLRLRYEIRREFAPYVGVEWSRKFGGSADMARNAGLDSQELYAVAGLRFWF